MLKNILIGITGTVVGATIGIAGFINLNTRYCDVCGERYLSLNGSVVCDSCKGYKEAKMDDREWIKATAVSTTDNTVTVDVNGELHQFTSDNIDYYNNNDVAYVKCINNQVSSIY